MSGLVYWRIEAQFQVSALYGQTCLANYILGTSMGNMLGTLSAFEDNLTCKFHSLSVTVNVN